MRRLGISILAAGLVLALSSCATINSLDASKQQQARIAVEGGTVALIERSSDKAAKAAQVLEYTAKAKTLLLDTGTTVGALRAALLQRVAERNLSPGEKLLALETINTVSDYVEQRIGAGVLNADGVLAVNTVLGWVESTAKLYVTS